MGQCEWNPSLGTSLFMPFEKKLLSTFCHSRGSQFEPPLLNPVYKYPQFIMWVSAQAKNGDKQFWKQKFMQPMGRLSMGGGFFFLCYQHVPFKFPFRFPIAPHFNPICLAQSPPLLTYIPGRKGKHSISLQDILFWRVSIVLNFYVMCSNSFQHK